MRFLLYSKQASWRCVKLSLREGSWREHLSHFLCGMIDQLFLVTFSSYYLFYYAREIQKLHSIHFQPKILFKVD